MKEDRWYEIEGDTLYVYNAPYKSQASGSSIVHVRDMPYYRANFRLRKIWGESPIQQTLGHPLIVDASRID